MANKFVNSKQVKLFLAELLDAAPYLKASKAWFAGQWKGKKAGKNGSNYVLYLNDAGNPTDGMEIQDGEDASVSELPVPVSLKHKKTLVDLDVLESVVDIEDFKNEVADPYATRLGAEIQADVIAATYFDGCTAFVSKNGWKAMSKCSAHLRSIRQGAKVTGYMDPMASGNLAVDALNGFHFAPSEATSKLYGDNAIGRFGGSDYVEVTDIPRMTGVAVNATISSATFDTAGNADIVIGAAVGTALPKGYPLVLGSAFACNRVGMKTNAPFVCFLREAATASATTLKVGRITVEDIGARNCFIAGTFDPDDPDGLLAGKSLTSILDAGVEYYAIQHRVNDVLEFETVPMDDLDGAENSSATVSGMTLKVTKMGNFKTMTNSTRWDVHYANGVADNRLISIAFMPTTESEVMKVQLEGGLGATSGAPLFTKSAS